MTPGKFIGGGSYGDILTRERESDWIAFLRNEPGIRESSWTEAAAIGQLVKMLHAVNRAVRVETHVSNEGA